MKVSTGNCTIDSVYLAPRALGSDTDQQIGRTAELERSKRGDELFRAGVSRGGTAQELCQHFYIFREVCVLITWKISEGFSDSVKF